MAEPPPEEEFCAGMSARLAEGSSEETDSAARPSGTVEGEEEVTERERERKRDKISKMSQKVKQFSLLSYVLAVSASCPLTDPRWTSRCGAECCRQMKKTER